MKKLTYILSVAAALAAAAPALAVDGSGRAAQLAPSTFAPRDDGDNTTDTTPPPDDGVTDPVDDPAPEEEPPAE